MTALGAVASLGQTPGTDRVELFNGQVFSGTVADSSLIIVSGLGTVQAPLDRIAGLACQPAPRLQQTLTLRDGDVLIGRVQAKSIHLTQEDGSAIELPLSQISRVSLGAAAGPTSLPAAAVATVYGLGGDWLAVQSPEAIQFRTRWGVLTAGPPQLRQLVLVDGQQAAHRLVLSDGSSCSGMVIQQTFTFQPSEAPDTTLTTPVGQIQRIAAADTDPARPGPRLEMIGGDVLRGAIQGTLAVETQYGPVSVEAGGIQKVVPIPESPGDVAVTLRDGRVLRGAPQDEPVAIALECGLSIKVPADMIASYARSAPPSPVTIAPPSDDAVAQTDPAVANQVQMLVRQLAGNNVQVRQRAQNDLAAIGKPAVALLNQLRPTQLPRVQRQIDAILQRIEPGGGN